MQVGGVQACLAAIGPGPARGRADQPHAGAGRVEVNLVGRREQVGDVGLLEEVRRAVRTVDDADLPILRQRRRLGRVGIHRRRVAEMEHVAGLEHAGGVAAEGAEREGGPRAEHHGRREAAAQRQVGALARPLDRADGERLARPDRERRAVRPGLAVEGEPHRGARERHEGVRVEAQRRPRDGEFEGAGLLPVADQSVGAAEGAGIHRPARRHADLPQAQPAGQLLQARLRAGQQNLDAARAIIEVAQGGGRHAPAGEKIGGGDGAQVVEIGLDAGDGGLGERRPERRDRRRPVGAGDDDLGQHRVVERRHLGARVDPAVDAGVRWKPHLGEQAGAGGKIGVRDLGVESRLDRRAPRHERAGLADRILARGLAHHPFHEVDAEHGLRHRMLDLEPRVHFKEREVFAIRIVDELDRAGRGVGDACRQSHRRGVEPCADRVGEAGGGRFLDHLLVSALERAVALAQSHDAALPVAEDLHLDMAGPRHEALEIDAGIAEAGPRRALDRGEALGQFLRRMAELHPDAAAARRALEHDGVADRLGGTQRGLDVGQ